MPLPTDTLPPDRRPAVDRALRAAFGTADLDAITPVSGGLSGAGVHRVEIGGAAYLLRLDGPRDGLRDPARSHACMRIAAEAGLAPRVLHADAEAGVAITDFIVAQPPAIPRSELVAQLGRTVRALHDTPAFPPLVDYLDGLKSLTDSALGSGLPTPTMAAQAQAVHAALSTAYRRLEPQLVSSHNDLNPGNIVHDGQRPWLVDWDSAFLADRYVDLAAVANVYARDPADEAILLEAYFEAPPTPDRQARLYLARQISHLFHAMIFIGMAAGERPGARLSDSEGDGRTLAQLHLALAGGEPLLAAWEGRVAYGLAHLAEALAHVGHPRLAEATRLAR
jgi:aminoglycoside phosphotransferase (APT) family kinase protein